MQPGHKWRKLIIIDLETLSDLKPDQLSQKQFEDSSSLIMFSSLMKLGCT